MRNNILRFFFLLPIIFFAECRKDPPISTADRFIECEHGWCKKTIWDNSNSNTDEFSLLSIADIAFLNDSTIVIAGTLFEHEPHGIIFRSTDLGETWSIKYAVGGMGSDISSMFFENESVGYYRWNINYEDIIYKTIDGGISWTRISELLEYNHHFLMKTPLLFLSDLVGFDESLKTIDGGNSWSTMPDLDSVDVSDFCFINDSTGYATSHEGNLFRTTNAGDAWNFIYSDSTLDFKTCFYSDSLTGFIGGTQLLKTTNGGLNWNVVLSADVNDICFVNQLMGFAVGKDGIFKTTDGGNNWQLNYQPKFKNLNSVKFRNENLGYVAVNQDSIPVGRGFILKTTTLGE